MRGQAVVMLLATSSTFAATWWLASGHGSRAARSDVMAPAPAAASMPVAARDSGAVEHRAPPLNVPPDASPAPVAQWVADTGHPNAATRAAAISALARAPRAEVLPVLRRVLLNGEPGIDRPAALRSLREMALAQGDVDGAIREAVRAAIYHGDDAAPAAEAQDTLDAIELAQAASASQR